MFAPSPAGLICAECGGLHGHLPDCPTIPPPPTDIERIEAKLDQLILLLRPVPCAACGGTGEPSESAKTYGKLFVCPGCNGAGVHYRKL